MDKVKKAMTGCSGCGKRREMIKEAYKRGGIREVVKEVPNVIRTFKPGEPNIRNKKWPK